MVIKIVYLRHTPFSIDIIEDYFNSIPNFGEEGFCQISKYGDLISNIFLKIVLPPVQISNNNIVENNNIKKLIDQYNNQIKLYLLLILILVIMMILFKVIISLSNLIIIQIIY